MVRVADPRICVRCKGRLWCGLSKCSVLEQKRRLSTHSPKSLDVIAPTPPAVFIGWKNYPKIEVSPMEALGHLELAENPGEWVNMSIDEILDVRTALLRPTVHFNACSAADPIEQLVTVQELAMSKEAVGLEAKLEKIPKAEVMFGQTVAPMGPKAPAKSIISQENPKVDRRIEKLYYDDVRAEDAIVPLFEKGYDVYTLSRILSAGILGVRKDRKLVPTRRAITAVDDIIYRKEIGRIKSYELISKYQLYETQRFDNHFYIILAPEVWGFEMLEAWAPGSAWHAGEGDIIINDWEDYRGRKEYASNVGGSYYAARVAVIEKLLQEKKQARAIIIREVREGYYVPLGVWQVRENVRDALNKGHKEFESIGEILEYIKPRLRVSVEKWTSESVLIRKMLNQRRITEWCRYV